MVQVGERGWRSALTGPTLPNTPRSYEAFVVAGLSATLTFGPARSQPACASHVVAAATMEVAFGFSRAGCG